MGKKRLRSVGTPWLRALGALGLVLHASSVWLVYDDEVPGWIGPWILAGLAFGALVSGFWLVTGKTLRMKAGEIFGDRPPRHDAIDGALFSSKAEARWWLAAMASTPLAVLVVAGILVAGLPAGLLLVPGLAVGVSGLYWWWFWPAWTAGEPEGSITRLWLRPGWRGAPAWGANSLREAFEVAGLPVSQVPKARSAYFTLLAGGMVALLVAIEAANPVYYPRAEALVRDLETKGSLWECDQVDVDGYGYERAAYESDAALCRRTGDRMFVHVFTVRGNTKVPFLPDEESDFTAWVRGPYWIVETTDLGTAREIEEAIGGVVMTERPLE